MTELKPMFSPHKVLKQQIKALKDHVLVHDMSFDVRITQSGIILPNDNGKGYGIRPRWGRVYAVGPEQDTVQVGQWIMVAHGRWTRGLEIEDENGEITLRKIDPKDILLITDSEVSPQDDTMSTAVHIDKKTMA
jgi:co-chaperonin GroES (HSP10)